MDGHVVLLPESYRKFGYITRTLVIIEQPYQFYKPACRVDELLLPGHVFESGNYHEPTLRAIRHDLLGISHTPTPYRRIYISRRNARFRKLRYEDAFTGILKKHGFEIHYFENYALYEQIRLMQETRFLIGMHGAGLTNILFMPSGSRVMELRFPGDHQNNCYYSLASAGKVEYYYHLGTNRSADTHTDNLEIDLGQAENSIREMLSD